ncbi:MAG TPA: hypothetical protein VJK73_01720 [Candidatus Paceibacterota bacterium]
MMAIVCAPVVSRSLRAGMFTCARAREEEVYVQRIFGSDGAAGFKDPETHTSYCVAVWPGHKSERRLRFYVTLSTGEIFLVERSMKEAVLLLHLDPPLPQYVRREAERLIRRYIELPEPA